MKTLIPALSILFLFCACERKVYKADHFDGITESQKEGAFFGRVIPEMKFGKKPGCRIEAAGKLYELPEDGMVYIWGPKGELAIDSIACYRNKNWLPKVVFFDRIPLFNNVGNGKLSYFGTLKVKIRDPEEIPAGVHGPFKTEYTVTDEIDESTQILRDNFPALNHLKVEKHLAVPTQVE